MWQKVRETIENYKLLKQYDKIVVAVSGGVDSVVLLDVLNKLSEEYHWQLIVAHLNHGFRGAEADADAQLVEQLADSYQLESFIEKISVPHYIMETKQSPQEAARNVRYEFLERVRQKTKATAIAVGQNANDQAETILINLLRGGGVSGLKGIPVKRDEIVRPLLGIKREEIEYWAKMNSLSFCFDSSNANTVYLRNKIRLKLIPHLEETYNPMLVNNLNKTAAVLAAEDQYLTEKTAEKLAQIVVKNDQQLKLDLTLWAKEDIAIQRRIIRAVYDQLASESNCTLGFDHVEQVIHWAKEGKTGGLVALPGKVTVRKEYSYLIFTVDDVNNRDKTKFSQLWQKAILVNVPGETIVEQLGITVKTEVVEHMSSGKIPSSNNEQIFLDGSKLFGKDIYIRSRRPGDRFSPKGMKGTKKLKDFFIDEKIPSHLRGKIPLLTTGKGEIIWVMGYRMAQGYQAIDSNKPILQVAFTQLKNRK